MNSPTEFSKPKSWDQIAEESCTCQDRKNECCPAHYQLWFNTYTQELESQARNIKTITENLNKLEQRRRAWITRKLTTT